MAAGISAVAYVDKSVASVSLAPLYFLPLALSALVHPLRISLALSIVCLVLHDLVGPMRDLGTRHLARDVASATDLARSGEELNAPITSVSIPDRRKELRR